jgi:transcriptional regulator with XRE-family HTH domain
MPVRDPVLRKFGANIRTRREALKLSQEALAERADLDRNKRCHEPLAGSGTMMNSDEESLNVIRVPPLIPSFRRNAAGIVTRPRVEHRIL